MHVAGVDRIRRKRAAHRRKQPWESIIDGRWIVWWHEVDGVTWHVHDTENAALDSAYRALHSDRRVGDPVIERPNRTLVLGSEFAAYVRAREDAEGRLAIRGTHRVEIRYPLGVDRWISQGWTSERLARANYDEALEHFRPDRVRLTKRDH